VFGEKGVNSCFQLCHMPTTFQNSFTEALNSNFRQISTPHFKRVAFAALGLLYVFARKSSCPCSLSELPCKTQSSKIVAEKYPSNDVSIILFNDDSIFTLDTPKNTQKNRLYNLQQPRRKMLRQNACELVQSLSRRVASG